jgi:uroporphyrinogen-III synthase
LRVAEGFELREKLLQVFRERTVVASIGPVMTDALAREGLTPDFIPKQPKLAVFIRQLAQQARLLLAQKRRPSK